MISDEEVLFFIERHRLHGKGRGLIDVHLLAACSLDGSFLCTRDKRLEKAAHDLVRKKRIYHQHQVPHYWIIDPRDETLTVHRWGPDGYIQVLLAQRGERVRAEPFQAIELPVGTFFGDDEEEGDSPP